MATLMLPEILELLEETMPALASILSLLNGMHAVLL